MASIEEEPVAFYQRYIDCCNEHRFDELDEFVTDDVNGPDEGLKNYVDGLKDVVRAFPDYRWDPQDVMVDGDRVAVRLLATGTHTGPFRGVNPTGRRIRTQELVIYHLRDGKIARCWGDLGTTVRDELVSGGD
jgi:predicted ester cyclase